MLNETAPTRDHAWIAAHIPHAGRMCLLDRVVAWDASYVLCSADSHRRPDHPLRQFDRLGAACGIEYAAQTMAVHGALVAEHGCMPDLSNTPDDGQPTLGRPGGLLVSLRTVQLHVARIDDIAAALEVCVERLSGDAQMLLYQFRVLAGDSLLLDGRASVVLDAAGLDPSFASTPP